MHSLLMMTSLMFFGSSTNEESPSQREIALHISIVGVDGTVDVPDEVESPAEFVAALRGNQGVKWSEDFRLYAIENTAVSCMSGSTVPVVSGYNSSPNGRRPFEQSGQVSPFGRGATVPPANAGNANGAMPIRNPTVRMEAIGTSAVIKPKVLSNGTLFLDVKLESSRHDALKNEPDPMNSPTASQTAMRKWEVETSIAVKSKQAILLRTSEAAANGALPDQTVLVVITATVED